MAEKTNGFNAGGLFAGDNGKAFFDWMGTNQRAQEIFTGLLEEFGKGMGLQNQVAQLQALTKVVIPYTSICPEPMSRYNSWTAPTTPAATTAAAA